VKIAFYVTQLLEHGGGLEKYFIETARELRQRPGIHADVFTMDDAFNLKFGRWHSLYFCRRFDPRIMYKEPLEAIRRNLGAANYFKARSLRHLAEELNGYDVIYSRNEITEAFFLNRLGYQRLPPVIFGCHTQHYYPIARSFHARLHNFLYTSWLYNRWARGVAGFHVINQFTFDLLRRQFPGKPIWKILHPFDAVEFDRRATLTPPDPTFDKARFHIVWVGRLTEQKGVAELVRLMDELNPTLGERVAWHICGEGELRPLVEAAASRWQNVTVHGYLAHHLMPGLLRQCDLFISTSRWEAYPYNLLEAQAVGLPAITFNICGCADILDQGVNGFLVESLDAFKAKVSDFVAGQRLPTDVAAHLRAKINVPRIYDDLVRMFEEVAARKKGAGQTADAGGPGGCVMRKT
jgi:glycosyltransferase involved in cell wall biosynthesis